MCLRIPINPALVAPKQSYIKVYKIYNYVIRSGKLHVTALHYNHGGFFLKKGLIIISNRPHYALTPEEIRIGEVHKGLHAWTTIKEAKKYKLQRNQVLVEFHAYPHNFICRGTHNQILYMKLTVNNIVDVTGTRKIYYKSGFSYDKLVNYKKVPVKIKKAFKPSAAYQSVNV